MMAGVGESTSDDLAEFWAANGGRTAKCRVPAILATLPPERSGKLADALARPYDGEGALKHTAIAEVLGKWGIEIGQNAISRHRRRVCKCPKT